MIRSETVAVCRRMRAAPRSLTWLVLLVFAAAVAWPRAAAQFDALARGLDRCSSATWVAGDPERPETPSHHDGGHCPLCAPSHGGDAAPPSIVWGFAPAVTSTASTPRPTPAFAAAVRSRGQPRGPPALA